MNRKFYRQLAKKHGVSVKEVKRDMQIAIDEAYKNPNNHALNVRFKGEKPTIDEFINYVAQNLKTKT